MSAPQRVPEVRFYPSGLISVNGGVFANVSLEGYVSIA